MGRLKCRFGQCGTVVLCIVSLLACGGGSGIRLLRVGWMRLTWRFRRVSRLVKVRMASVMLPTLGG